MDLDRKIGEELRAARKSKGIEAKWVSTRMGISPGYLCDLEQGRRRWTGKLIAAYKRAICLIK